MERNGEGTKPKLLIHVDGLGTSYLSDSDVDISAKFYTHHPLNATYQYKTINKSQMVAYEEGDCNDYYCIVDTTGLGYGLLKAEVTVTYHDADTNTNIVEKVKVDTDIILEKNI